MDETIFFLRSKVLKWKLLCISKLHQCDDFLNFPCHFLGAVLPAPALYPCLTPSTDKLFPDIVSFHIDIFHLGMHKTHHKYRCTPHHQDGITVRWQQQQKQKQKQKPKQTLFLRQMGLQSRVGRSGLFYFYFFLIDPENIFKNGKSDIFAEKFWENILTYFLFLSFFFFRFWSKKWLILQDSGKIKKNKQTNKQNADPPLLYHTDCGW